MNIGEMRDIEKVRSFEMPRVSKEVDPNKEVYSTGEVARICNLSQQTIIRCFDAGKLKGFRVPGSRFRRIPRESLIQFMRENGIPTGRLTPRKKILIVDDDEELLQVLTDFFEQDARFELRSASTGFTAGVATREFQPDLMLLDIMLPDINGQEVCKMVKSSPATRWIRIIAISGMIEKEKIDDLYSAGIDAYIQKPFDLDLLKKRVCEVLGMP